MSQVVLRALLTLCLAEHVRDTRDSNRSRKAASSRPGKRKADVEPVAASSGSDEDAFERMDLDKDKAAEEEREISGQASTPERSDLDATEDEVEDNLDPAPATQPKKYGIGSIGKAIEMAKKQSEAKSQSTKATPPPQRELPFTQTSTAKGALKEDPPHVSTTEAQNAAVESDTEGATDDDEL